MKLTVLISLAGSVTAIDNGLGRTPPMGWRSWNLYRGNVNQQLIMSIMDGMASKKRTVDGVPTSLCDLGYCDVGLDDNWQACGAGNKYNYHDDSGIPIINRSLFPNFIDMTDHAHAKNLTAGWYGNNCICHETEVTDDMYVGDVAALTEFGFDSVKLDGCGKELDLERWADLINATGRPIMIENCHGGSTVPNETWCPWNFFRTSSDIQANYGSVIGNLQTTIQWATNGLSKPGCWAYPDMLQVGCSHGPSDLGLSNVETRSHFAAWAVVSAPLTLSHDVNDDSVMDAVWPLISNKEIIAVNQAWAGHSGSPFKQSLETVTLENYTRIVNGMVRQYEGQVPRIQYFYKPLGNKEIAVLLMNHGDSSQDLTLDFKDIPGVACSKCKLRCLFEQKDVGEFDETFTATQVTSHDSRFFVVSPAKEAVINI